MKISKFLFEVQMKSFCNLQQVSIISSSRISYFLLSVVPGWTGIVISVSTLIWLLKTYHTGNKILETRVENFLMNQSGWSIHCINDLTIRILRMRQLKGGCYLPFPRDLLAKEKPGAVLNISNSATHKHNDGKMFLWRCLAKHFPEIGKKSTSLRSNRLVKTYKKANVVKT